MDPVGPWTSAYAASYNRLAGATGGFQPTAGGGGDYAHHSPSVPSTSSQLLLHAHTSSSIAGISAGSGSAFNPGGFLSPPAVGYDPTFSPYLHHANQQTHYPQALSAVQHRQAMASSKTPEPSNYNSAHHPVTPSPVYFDQATAAQPPSITLSQNKATLPSPFGVLPHESVVGSSPNGASAKPTSPYENFGPAHFAPAHTLNHTNSMVGTYGDGKHLVTRHTHSPPLKTMAPIITSSNPYFQQTSPTGYSRSQNASNQCTIANAHSSSSLGRQSQNSLANPNIPQSLGRFPIDDFSRKSQEKTPMAAFQAPATIHSDRRETIVESCQSSPISYALTDSTYKSSANIPSRSGNLHHQLQQPVPHQKTGGFRTYPSSTGSTPESEYSKGSVNRKASTDGGYSSGSSVGQNSGDCCTLQQSPLNHSQPSPVGHVTSPASYPIYHSPMTSMSSPSPVQHLPENGSYIRHPSPQLAPSSPLDVSVAKPVAHMYSPVMPRNDQNFTNDRGVELAQNKPWEEVEKEQLRSNSLSYPVYPGIEPQSGINTLPVNNHMPLEGLTESQQEYFDTDSSVGCSMLNSRENTMNTLKNLQTAEQQCQSSKENTTNTCNSLQSAEQECQSLPIQSDRTEVNTTFVNKKQTSKRKRSSGGKSNSKALNTDKNSIPSQMHSNPCQESRVNVDSIKSPHKAKPEYENSVQKPLDTEAAKNTNSQILDNLAPQQSESKSLVRGSADTSNSKLTVDLQGTPKFDTPKVIVPDIEEELAFLAEPPKICSKSNVSHGKQHKSEEAPPIILQTNRNFLNTFLNFIEGTRVNSPALKPALKRGTPLKPYVPPVQEKEKTGENVKQKNRIAKVRSPSPCNNFEDDPRYFPLPKDSSNRRLDTSSGSELDYDNVIPKITYDPSKYESKEPVNKSGKNKIVKNSRGKLSNTRRSRKRSYSSDEDEEEVEQPEPIKPKQKPQRKLKKVIYDEESDVTEFNSSDSDPAWVPSEEKAKSDGRRRSQRFIAKSPVELPKTQGKVTKNSRFLDSSDDENNDSDREGDPSITCSGCNKKCLNPKDQIMCSKCKNHFHSGCCNLTESKIQKLGAKRKTWKCSSCKSSTEIPTSAPKKPVKKTHEVKKTVKKTETKKEKSKVVSFEEDSSNSLGPEEFFPFKSGDFLVVKSELVNEFPPIWRVDGKTLLQKYEPFDQNGEKLYKNISTYSGWTPQNREIYEKIPVQFVMQSRFDTIVKFLRSEMVDPQEEEAFLNHSLSEMAKYQDHFEVYIQTLISQALDSNFLAEILAEKDEYFLENVEMIDSITEARRKRLVAALEWPAEAPIQRSLVSWPCYNVLADLKVTMKLCDACDRNKVHARLVLYGQPYNPAKLDCATADAATGSKDFVICLDCIKWVQLFNKLVHQKYIMYIECAKRVAERRAHNSAKETTEVLNELLADENWLNKLFRQVRVTWAEVEKAEREKCRRLGISVKPPPVNNPSLPALPAGSSNQRAEVTEEHREKDIESTKANDHGEAKEDLIDATNQSQVNDDKEKENNETEGMQGNSENMETQEIETAPSGEHLGNKTN